MKGSPISYTPEELEWIKSHRAMSRRDAHRLFCQIFGRDDVSFANFKALCTRKGWKTGRTGQFKPDHEPANKGKKMPYNANQAHTQFKKGRLPHNTNYLGHERMSKNGYVEISVAETNPRTGFERRYVLTHRHLWEQENGPLPASMCLKCIDGNRLNTDPSNWQSIPRGALPFLNGWRGPDYEAAAAEVRPATLTLAKLKHVRGSKRKGRKPAAPTDSANQHDQ